MKKIRLILYLFVLISNNINAFENFAIKGNIIYFGIGYQVHTPEDYTLECDFLNIAIEHKYTKIGIEYSLAKLWNWFYSSYNEDINYIETFRVSMLNLGIYWNALDFLYNNDSLYKFYLGPFTKFNYLFFNENIPFRSNEYIISAGIRYGIIRRIDKNIYYSFLGGELGYRNINGNNTFYVNVNIDIIGWIVGILVSKPLLIF
jgi:hypothetical protein